MHLHFVSVLEMTVRSDINIGSFVALRFLRTITLATTLLPLTSWAQCNGHPELCDKRYNEVAYLTTHNAFNAEEEGFQLPNQTFGLTQQLQDGVRAFMLDVYDEGGTATVYHGFSLLGTATLADNLVEIKDFLDANPNEVVTIIFESYVDATMMDNSFTDVGLIPYLHEQTLGEDWPTLQQMINAGTQLVVLSDNNDALPTQGWYHYVWDFAVETGFSNNSPSDFSCEFNRGDSINDLFILNHFVTDATIGTGQTDQAAIVNAFDFFYPRILECQVEKQKLPNFPTVDFYELGETKRVVDSLNLNPIHIGIGSAGPSSFKVETIGNGVFRILIHQSEFNHGQISVFSAVGRSVDQFVMKNNGDFTLDLQAEPKGAYIVRLTDPITGSALVFRVFK